MQFSLRWILAATAYVALAAATLSQGSWYLADILWAASLLAIAYALLLASFARGNRQAKAIGFVAASSFFVLALHCGGVDNVPTTRLLKAAGVPILYPAPGAPIYTLPTPSQSGSQPPIVAPTPFYDPSAPRVQYLPGTFPAAVLNPPTIDLALCLRAANAVGMVAFGLLGYALGALAFRTASPKADVR